MQFAFPDVGTIFMDSILENLPKKHATKETVRLDEDTLRDRIHKRNVLEQDKITEFLM